MMGILFDLIYDWIIHVVPAWLSWVLMTPLIVFLALLAAAQFYPSPISN